MRENTSQKKTKKLGAHTDKASKRGRHLLCIYIYILRVAKIALRDTILANLGNREPKIKKLAKPMKQHPPPARRCRPAAWELFFTDLLAF